MKHSKTVLLQTYTSYNVIDSCRLSIYLCLQYKTGKTIETHLKRNVYDGAKENNLINNITRDL